MRAVQIIRFGEPEVLQMVELTDLRPRAGEVVIRTRAIGVNFTDLFARMGLPGRDSLPFVPGMEVAGVIGALGADAPATLRTGQGVIGFTPFTLGGYAELVAVPIDYVYPLPAGIPFEHAACFTLNYGTAYAALRYMAQIRPGERVLIHAAAGGVGLAAVQLARLAGAEIFATASAAKHEFLRAQGVAHPIDYHTVAFDEEIRRIIGNTDEAGDPGVDVVLNSIGGASVKQSFDLLRFGGRLVCYGESHAINTVTGFPPRIEETLQPDSIRIAEIEDTGRAIMGTHLGVRPELLSAWMQAIFALYLDGQIGPHIGRTFSLAEAAQAHRYIHERQNIGKVLRIP